MKIHEYQAKEILKKYGLPIPLGYVASDKSEVSSIYKKLGTNTVVIKAQIHAGGRGKGGGVKLAHNEKEAIEYAEQILGMQLVTPQTGPEGKKVLKILIEEAMPIAHEFYAGITLDRRQGKPVLMVSAAGGMDIEEIAKFTPEKILTETIEPCLGLQRWQASRLAYELGLTDDLAKKAIPFFLGLWQVYDQEDCSLVEVNPLVTTKDGRLLALDAKINFDDNALFRHSEHLALRDLHEEDPLEVEASKYRLNYVRLTGNVGCMVNGAGLAMATMDIIKQAGAFPANFLDVGGGANVEMVTNGFKIILSDPNVKGIFVNIFGGIVRCDRIAQGIIEAANKVKIDVPLVVRLAGTNAEEATKLLLGSGLSLEVAQTLEEGAKKIVGLIQK